MTKYKKELPMLPVTTKITPFIADLNAALIMEGLPSYTDLLEVVKSLAFVAESVAHLRGMERELLPTCDLVREYLERVEKSV